MFVFKKLYVKTMRNMGIEAWCLNLRANAALMLPPTIMTSHKILLCQALVCFIAVVSCL